MAFTKIHEDNRQDGKGEDSRPRGSGFKSRPCCRDHLCDHLSCTINLDQNHESLNCGIVTNSQSNPYWLALNEKRVFFNFAQIIKALGKASSSILISLH